MESELVVGEKSICIRGTCIFIVSMQGEREFVVGRKSI